ncbi:MAG: spirocyclase AveC family protein [Actinomycetota bacterium]
MLTEPSAAGRVTAAQSPARRRAPVKVWAAVGAVFLALQLWIYGSWLTTGEVASPAPGPTPIPDWMHVAIRVFEAGSVLGAALFVWLLLIRPWRRAGHITLDGLFTLAFLTFFWQDPLMNFIEPWFTYNAGFVSVASWGPHIPGWSSPDGHLLPQGVVMFLPAYAYALFGGTILAGVILRRTETRWPGLRRGPLIAVCFTTLVVLDTAIELVALRLNLWAFPGAIRWLSFFPGTRHQFPIYEAVLLGGAWTAWAALRHFRDDRGRTMVERGVDDLPAGPRARTGLRFLALVGFCNVAYLTYNLLFAVLGTFGGPWPDDVRSRSYLNNGRCGVGTTRVACPGD